MKKAHKKYFKKILGAREIYPQLIIFLIDLGVLDEVLIKKCAIYVPVMATKLLTIRLMRKQINAE